MTHYKSWMTAFIISTLIITNMTAEAITLENVRKRGFIRVGVNGNLPGFGMSEKKKGWSGLDVDTGKAVAAAVFGDAKKIKFIALTVAQRFTALQSDKIDLLCSNATQTLNRDAAMGLDFVQVNYYDGQGFLVPKKSGIQNARELDGAAICVLPTTTTQQNLTDFFQTNHMEWKPVVIEKTDELHKVFFAGGCDCITSDTSHLAGLRAMASNPADYLLLSEIISKEPLAPVVRHGDNQWKDIVNYSVLAMINAEELGITSKNVDEMLKSNNPKIRRFLGVVPGNGDALGLNETFAYYIIKQVGNYGEVFERNVGLSTPLGIPRGLNALWRDGGLMYSPPFE